MTQRQVHPAVSLKVQGLAVGRGDTILARAINFTVAPNEGLWLRGPNGAGKSTLLLTLAGLLPPIEGQIDLAGKDPEDGPILHYCGHRNAVRPRITVGATLAFWAAINGGTGLAVEVALARVGLSNAAALDAGFLSAGQQRRLALARLLVSRRSVWLLDEPSAALDAEGHRLVAELVAEHLGNGGIAVIATHDDLAVPGLSTLTLGAAA